MTSVKFLGFALLLSALLALCACTTQTPTPASQAISNEKAHFVSRTYSADLNCTLFAADKAVRQAADDMHLVMLSKKNRQVLITYEYKTPYEDRFDVELTQKQDGQIHIVAKLGKGGKRAYHKEFLDAVGAALDQNLQR